VILRDEVGVDDERCLRSFTKFSSTSVGEYELEEVAGFIETRFGLYPSGEDIEGWTTIARIAEWVEDRINPEDDGS
jgi:hypothetical protein